MNYNLLYTNWNMIAIYLIILLVFVVNIFVLMRLMIASRELQLKRYDLELQRAKMTDDRHYFESRMADLAARLSASEHRWRDANQLIVSGTRAGANSYESTFDSPFLSKFGISKEDLSIDRRLVLVLTPFSDEEFATFKEVRDICSEVGLTAVRGDETFTRGDILAHVISIMTKARIVIANISTRNANVYYELGIAHALDKTTILISRSINDTPFDVKNQRIVVFRNSEELRENLKTALVRAATDSWKQSEHRV